MRGRRIGQGKSKVLIIRIPLEWWDALEELHRANGTPPVDTIRGAVETYLQKKNKL